jgi:hypothetical protein
MANVRGVRGSVAVLDADVGPFFVVAVPLLGFGALVILPWA